MRGSRWDFRALRREPVPAQELQSTGQVRQGCSLVSRGREAATATILAFGHLFFADPSAERARVRHDSCAGRAGMTRHRASSALVHGQWEASRARCPGRVVIRPSLCRFGPLRSPAAHRLGELTLRGLDGLPLSVEQPIVFEGIVFSGRRDQGGNVSTPQPS
jgi:hypothetical protein